jgi:citronellol/citronellal dehydrogenase
MTLAGKVLFITGASRGIGLAIALRAARDGAAIAIAAKTVVEHPKLPGTIHTAATEIEAAGGKALAIQCDIRDEEQVQNAINETVTKFGKLDILVNNASAISLTDTLSTEMKRYDLMNQVNGRGTFLCSKLAIPYLEQSDNGHILNLSPPLNMSPRWFGPHVAYTMAKYSMSMCTLGMAEELKSKGIAVNSLWPETAIATAAVKNLLGGEDALKCSRTPDIVADAAHHILTQKSADCTGNFFIDSELLRSTGVEDLDKYAVSPGSELMKDFFL